MKIAMLGEGAWGTAVSTVLADNGHDVTLWCNESQCAAEINTRHTNQKYAPDVSLSSNISATAEIQSAMSGAHIVFEAIPVQYLRPVLEKAKPYYNQKQVWVALSKGIEQNTLLLPTQMIENVFGKTSNLAVMSGPTFAVEVLAKQLTAIAVASKDEKIDHQLQQIVANDYFRPFVCSDTIGVQVGGALKNVITLIVGYARGVQTGDNIQALLFTRGFAELVAIAKALGGCEKTLYGLSGIGDLALCSMGSHSRNLEVGVALGAGENLESIIARTGYIPEGVNTIQSVHMLGDKLKIALPICSGMYQVIFEKRSFSEFLDTFTKLPLQCE
jgi:glycerol-3-phosphate dehydrogenase (NAD(P)+)